MSIILLSVGLLAAGVLVCILFKACAKPVLGIVLGIFLCLASVTLLFIRKGEAISQRGNSVGTLNNRDVPRLVSEEDQKFLNDLFRQQEQNNQREQILEVKPLQSVASAERDANPVPRAELVVNTSEVRRAQLVVNSRVVERAEPVRSKYQ